MNKHQRRKKLADKRERQRARRKILKDHVSKVIHRELNDGEKKLALENEKLNQQLEFQERLSGVLLFAAILVIVGGAVTFFVLLKP